MANFLKIMYPCGLVLMEIQHILPPSVKDYGQRRRQV
jgi:hypothetical protein